MYLPALSRLAVVATFCLINTACAADDDDASHRSGHSTSRINGSITIAAGEAASDADTINGSITIEPQASAGAVRTVNGGIQMGAGAHASTLTTVNGAISLDTKARVDGSVETVNGGIHLADHAAVTGKLGNVNGAISLEAAQVGGGLDTVNGDITIGADSRVQGGLHVEASHSRWLQLKAGKPPVIIIGPRAVVQGSLQFDRPVELHVSRLASIGPVSGATALPFDGDHP
ncbi:DUF4097 family beta strand repeat-containing protein [Frateuria aurantia]